MSDEDCGKGLIVSVSDATMERVSVSDDYGRVSVRHIAEQVGDRLAIVGAAHCLSEHHADLKNNSFRKFLTFLETSC